MSYYNCEWINSNIAEVIDANNDYYLLAPIKEMNTIYRYAICIKDNNRKFKLVCPSINKFIESNLFLKNNLDYKKLFVEELIDGFEINLFFDENHNLIIFTDKSIGGFNKYSNNMVTTSYREMFISVCEHFKIDLTKLEKDYCYSFIIQHPFYESVTKLKPAIYLISTFDRSKYNYNFEHNFTFYRGNNKNYQEQISFPNEIGFRNENTLTFYDEDDENNIQKYNPLDFLIKEWSNKLPHIVHASDVKERNEYRHHYGEMGIVIYNPETGMRMNIINPHYLYTKQRIMYENSRF